MADISDVENALVASIAAALYPSGVTPGAPSIVGPVCKVYRGWPGPASLDADLAAGIVNVTVYPQVGAEHNTTRYPQDWQMLTPASPKVTLSASGSVVTVGGAIQVGDFACIKVGLHTVYSVPVLIGSTLATIAAALSALVVVNYPGTSATGGVVTIATSATVLVATGGQGVAWQELIRQQQAFQITAWCSTPSVRDSIGAFIKLTFASVERMALADSSWSRLIYQRSIITDKNETQNSYRRDFLYTAEFPTSATKAFPSIGAFVANTSGGVSPSDSPAVPSVV